MSKKRHEAQLETSPERITCIEDFIDAAFEEGGFKAFDAFSSEESIRALAERVRLPYLALVLTQLGFDGLTHADIDEYVAWRATVGRKGT
ncbi:MAG: hypothetical protein U0587_08615 [Candidatus Binatia bacterium]